MPILILARAMPIVLTNKPIRLDSTEKSGDIFVVLNNQQENSMITKKSTKHKRHIDAAFKAEAVRIVHASGRPQREIASDIGVCISALSRWARDDREADWTCRDLIPP